MNLPCANEGRAVSRMAACAIGCFGGSRYIFFHLGGMVMGVAIEVAGMTFSAATAISTVDCGIATPANAYDT